MKYSEYLQSEHWKELAKKTKELAGNKCQVCNGTDALDAHHRDYSRIGHEEPNDVICLCHSCHSKFHFTEIEFDDEPLPPVVIFAGKSDSAWGMA